MIDAWNNLLKDEPIYSLLVSLASIGISVWLSTVYAKKAARREVAAALDLATRQEHAARLGRYQESFHELLNFFNPRGRAFVASMKDADHLDDDNRVRLADLGVRLEYLSEFLRGAAFTLELQLLDPELAHDSKASVAVSALHAELHALGLTGELVAPRDETETRLNRKWATALSEVATLYKRIFRTTFRQPA